MDKFLKGYLVCLECRSGNQALTEDFVECGNCGSKVNVENSIPRYVDGTYHSNFGLQWNMWWWK